MLMLPRDALELRQGPGPERLLSGFFGDIGERVDVVAEEHIVATGRVDQIQVEVAVVVVVHPGSTAQLGRRQFVDAFEVEEGGFVGKRGALGVTSVGRGGNEEGGKSEGSDEQGGALGIHRGAIPSSRMDGRIGMNTLEWPGEEPSA